MKMKGNTNTPKVKALLNIPNVVDAGKIYNLNDLKKWYPYLDFTNTDYFRRVFDKKAKFHVGDKVRFIGNPVKRHNYWYADGEARVSELKSYTVTRVTTEIKNDDIYYIYEITNSDESFDKMKEDDLTAAPDMWIVSFGCDKNRAHPDVHKIDYQGYTHKIVGTWKEMFLFDTQKEAEDAANLFVHHTIKEIIEKFTND